MTTDGKYVRLNKSYFKKVPIVHPDNDDDVDDIYDPNSESAENNTEDPLTTPEMEIVENNVRTAVDTHTTPEMLRRSSQTKTIPERYGVPIPSELIP